MMIIKKWKREHEINKNNKEIESERKWEKKYKKNWDKQELDKKIIS